MLKFLADENFPGDAIEELAGKGIDIVWIGNVAPGSSDEEVLKRAMNENRTLITFDKDFGELAFKRRLPATCGVILFRIQPMPPESLVRFINEVLESRSDWPGHFSVVESDQIRMRPIQGISII